MLFDVNKLKYNNDDGLIPAIIQDCETNTVLMMAYMNREAVQKTIESGETWFWSRSRKKFWHKGETSGNTQKIKEIFYDCDSDTLLITVKQRGAACHEGYYSCFHNNIGKDGKVTVVGEKFFNPDEVYGTLETPVPGTGSAGAVKALKSKMGPTVLEDLYSLILERKINPPDGSYTGKLFAGGLDEILKKVGEEATEVVIAGKNSDSEGLVSEMADLLYHLLVLLANEGVDAGKVYAELAARRGLKR
ncbi:MAG: bifunctional phosphoribosyl-AMP cyclohydrolase/phosphoribosyl-ATP diphosphatase HisIE [Desulfocucumaceae bacterium]